MGQSHSDTSIVLTHMDINLEVLAFYVNPPVHSPQVNLPGLNKNLCQNKYLYDFIVILGPLPAIQTGRIIPDIVRSGGRKWTRRIILDIVGRQDILLPP